MIEKPRYIYVNIDASLNIELGGKFLDGLVKIIEKIEGCQFDCGTRVDSSDVNEIVDIHLEFLRQVLDKSNTAQGPGGVDALEFIVRFAKVQSRVYNKLGEASFERFYANKEALDRWFQYLFAFCISPMIDSYYSLLVNEVDITCEELDQKIFEFEETKGKTK